MPTNLRPEIERQVRLREVRLMLDRLQRIGQTMDACDCAGYVASRQVLLARARELRAMKESR